MARLNLDDEFFGDEFVEALGAELGINKFEARGRLATLFWHAINDLRPIVDHRQLAVWFGWPISKAGELSAALVLTDWVKPIDDGFEIRGVRNYMGWLEVKRSSGAKGGRATAGKLQRDKKGHFLPLNDEKPKQVPGECLDEIQAASSPPAPALAPAPDTNKKSGVEIDGQEIDLWPIAQAYPNPFGLDVGIELLRPQIKTQQDYNDCLKAIKIYERECRRRNRHSEDFDNWVMNDWRKYLKWEKKAPEPAPVTPIVQDESPQRPLSEILKDHPDLQEKLSFIKGRGHATEVGA